jgi:hypothetical protein
VLLLQVEKVRYGFIDTLGFDICALEISDVLVYDPDLLSEHVSLLIFPG